MVTAHNGMFTDQNICNPNLNNMSLSNTETILKDNMIGIGLGGWMADFGEYLSTTASFYSGEAGERLHNRWPLYWGRMNREAVEETGTQGEVVFFMRAGYSGKVDIIYLVMAGYSCDVICFGWAF